MEYQISHPMEFTKIPDDPEYLAEIAREVQAGMRVLVSDANALNAIVIPGKVYVEPVNRFEDGKLITGIHLRAYVIPSGIYLLLYTLTVNNGSHRIPYTPNMSQQEKDIANAIIELSKRIKDGERPNIFQVDNL